MFAGYYSPIFPGEMKSLSIDFWRQLKFGDALLPNQIFSALTSRNPGDPNASALLVGPPAITCGQTGKMTNISQFFGVAQIPGIEYVLELKAVTANGKILINTGVIPCTSIV